MAEDERKRRGVLLTVGVGRTHRRQMLKFRIEGVTGAMAVEETEAGVGAG